MYAKEKSITNDILPVKYQNNPNYPDNSYPSHDYSLFKF